jgi:hypothetical protein
MNTNDINMREYFMGQALANSAICTGRAEEYELKRWFGNRAGITRAQIAAKQAAAYADAMLAEAAKK